MTIFPSYALGDYKFRAGTPHPFGATVVPDGINFAISSCNAASCSLVLFQKGAELPLIEIPFLDSFRTGDVYAMTVIGLDPAEIEYGFRLDGPYDPPAGHRFDAQQILLDPYAKAIGGLERWGLPGVRSGIYPYRARPCLDDFDWEGDQQLNTPLEDLVIYEMHVRGFTAHPSADVKAPGTYAAVIEKIPYLLELGVNCIELMPVFEFDELDNDNEDPETGAPLQNFWGYNPIGFFAPKAAYSACGQPARELKQLVKACHAHGIEVWLDVVLNHTAEGNEEGPTISYRGIDNNIYYLLKPDGSYHNFSGTGNTFNCNHPIARVLLLECLRYWVSEFHIDGFRFDLAASMGRDPQGNPDPNPPLLEVLAYDPILAHTKLIAEAWDAGGLYQVGSFPAYGRWAEWNGRYRDDLRRFVKGDPGLVGAMAARIQGSPDIYSDRGPRASVNFITCHDGFTLRDLVSYNEKHNLANGEDNRDGNDANLSWNCGVEGPTDDPAINELRLRQMKNFLSLLMVSQGLPMLFMGDETGQSKGGNNNSYCHDGPINYFDWDRLNTHKPLFTFVRNLIRFRAANPVLRRRDFLSFHAEPTGNGGLTCDSVSYHGRQPWAPDWSHDSRQLAVLFCGANGRNSEAPADLIYIIMNAHWEAAIFELPRLPGKLAWSLSVDTGAPAPEDSFAPGRERLLADQHELPVRERSVIILLAR
ncbi:MAG: glycogen debranching protein GlgX [Chloroflexi bacterium]|nr:glycogen debranching protein GlgX [Chloroflexota bacterium]